MNQENKTKNVKKWVIIGVILALVVFGVWFSHGVYWGPDTWLFGYAGADKGQDENGLPWIGAAEPELVVHEYIDYECPHCPTAHKMLRTKLNLRLGSVRLVRHDFARMPCAPNDAARKLPRCEMVRAGICAQNQGKFWQWNDAVIANPRPIKGKERKLYIQNTAEKINLDTKAFEACLFDKATIDKAQRIYKEARKKKINQTPTYWVNNKRCTYEEMVKTLNN